MRCRGVALDACRQRRHGHTRERLGTASRRRLPAPASPHTGVACPGGIYAWPPALNAVDLMLMRPSSTCTNRWSPHAASVPPRSNSTVYCTNAELPAGEVCTMAGCVAHAGKRRARRSPAFGACGRGDWRFGLAGSRCARVRFYRLALSERIESKGRTNRPPSRAATWPSAKIRFAAPQRPADRCRETSDRRMDSTCGVAGRSASRSVNVCSGSTSTRSASCPWARVPFRAIRKRRAGVADVSSAMRSSASPRV